ncbi:hypothetical protein L9F63_011787 [Diploptera punctata]|uniref:Uncharacterized protein n=1 Tax=Diploptera punctata TaxID=6984 RepID=A0AAD8AFE8_DIPPU|nr:hypothetical protein L9F63_011787 [Diploptera punctata]
MGISLEQWRASIGHWARGGVVSSNVNSAITSPQFYFLLVLLVLLVVGGVEMNPGPVQGSQQVKYRKTPGAADMAGELYECKLAALLFLRCINSEHEFHIASNMAAAVCYDDVVLTLGQCSAFLQLKHKQQKNAKIYISQLFTVKGDFSLIRCWKSFLNIKQRWAAEEDLQRCGQFNDCLFVMYTNASLVGSGDNNVGSNEMLDLVNTGGKLIQFTEMQHPDIYQFFRDLPRYKQLLSEAVSADQLVELPELLQVVQKLHNKQDKCVPEKEVLNELLKVLESLGDLSNYSDFLCQLRFCTEQKRQGALDDLIKSEVKVLFGNDKQSDKLTHGVEDWSRQHHPYLLTPNAKFFQDIIKTIAANISKHIPKLNITFSQDACQEIREKYQEGNRKLLIKSNCIKMSVIKVMQSFDSNTLLIDVSTIQECVSKVLAVWKYGKCDILVVEGGDISGLEDKLSTLSDSKCLVVISDIHKAEQQFVDTFCLSQLEPDSQQQVLECQVDFQGYIVRLNSLADESFLQTELSAEVVEQLHNTLQVGHKLQELDPCYLHRTFQRRDLLNYGIFKEKGITLAVSGATEA